MTKQAIGTALITGASSGIGKTYADRLAHRGYDLVLVARDRERMEALAAQLREETGVAIDIIRADLTDAADLRRVEARLAEDEQIDLLVNNAGMSAGRGFEGTDADVHERLISLNVTAVTRLATAVVPRFLAKGAGSVINIASVMAFMPEAPSGVYSATKAYVLTYSQTMQAELGPKGLYVQAVLPAATRTEIWERGGRDINTIPGLMEVDELVDAALVGFDRRELVTIPPLHDAAQWEAFEAARRTMQPGFQQERAAPRYRG
jgi:uncharacterized protein